MTRTTFQRWTIATLGFLAIGMLDIRFGHTVALVTLMSLMLLVAFLGGSGRDYGAKSATPDATGNDVQANAARSEAADSAGTTS